MCPDLADIKTRLSHISINLMQPFQPMLATGNLKDVAKIMQFMRAKMNLKDGQSFYVETKFDGDKNDDSYENTHILVSVYVNTDAHAFKLTLFFFHTKQVKE